MGGECGTEDDLQNGKVNKEKAVYVKAGVIMAPAFLHCQWYSEYRRLNVIRSRQATFSIFYNYSGIPQFSFFLPVIYRTLFCYT